MISNSIVTNSASLIALGTLAGIDTRLASIGRQISTGLKVSSAEDDSSVFAVAQGVRSDIKANTAIQETQAVTKGVLSVAIAGLTSISNMLNSLKETATALADPSLSAPERQIYQNDYSAKLNQIDQISGNASFNGVNLLRPSPTPRLLLSPTMSLSFAPGGDLNGNGIIDLGDTITFATTETQAPGTPSLLYNVVTGATWSNGTPIGALATTVGVTGSSSQSTTITIPLASADPSNIAGLFSAVDTTFVNGLPEHVHGDAAMGFTVGATHIASVTPVVTNGSDSQPFSYLLGPQGQLGQVQYYDMSAAGLSLSPPSFGAPSSLQSSLSSAADYVDQALEQFSVASREIDSAQTFLTSVGDASQTALGALVDADLGKASAELTATQTQQQLALQTLSIANAGPSYLRQLFS